MVKIGVKKKIVIVFKIFIYILNWDIVDMILLVLVI